MAFVECKGFLEACSEFCSWEDLSDKTVMEIGCGKGDDSTETFVEMFPNIRKLIGIDENEGFIKYAQKESSHPKVEYHVADILKWSTLSQWEGQMDVIISYFSFNYMNYKIEALEYVHKLLRPGGTAAVMFALETDFYDWVKEVRHIYKKYAKNCKSEPPDSHKNDLYASSYESDVAGIGFGAFHCKDEIYSKVFLDEEECKDFLMTICPVTSYIPDRLIKKFRTKIFSLYLQYHPRNEDSLPCFSCRVAKIVVKKSE